MLERLASESWNRPRAPLGAAVALLAALVAVAALTIDDLGTGSTRADSTAGPDLILTTQAPAGLPPNAHEVALETISGRVAADPLVTGARVVDRGKSSATATIEVGLAGDGGERRATAERILGELDPGPVQLHAGGETEKVLDAGSSLLDDLWGLELLVVPLVALALLAAFGLRGSGAPILAGATGAAGALAGLGLGGAFFDTALIAAVPGIALGVGLGVELSSLLLARLEDEAVLEGGSDALRSGLREGIVPLAYPAGVGALASAGLLASGLDVAGSIVLACSLAAFFALAGAVLAVPPLFALDMRSRETGGLGEERRLARGLAVLPRLLARERMRAGVASVVAIAVLVALAYPLAGASSAPLPAGAHQDSLVDELPVVGGVAAMLLGLAFAIRARHVRAALLGPVALLPAVAAAGVVAVVFQDGIALPASLGDPQELSNVGLASLLAVVAGIGAMRTAAAADAVRTERELDPGAAGVAERSAALALPAALVGTVVLAATAGVLVGADLRAAQELGLGIAVGLATDMLLARVAMLAAIASWGGDEERAHLVPAIAWRRWLLRAPRRTSATDSAS